MKRAVGLILGVLGVIIAAISVILREKESASISTAISIIGGADGPTSIFLAGKVGADFSTAGIIGGIVLIILGIVLTVCSVKRNS